MAIRQKFSQTYLYFEKKTEEKKQSFKKKNFKGSRLIARNINNFLGILD